MQTGGKRKNLHPAFWLKQLVKMMLFTEIGNTGKKKNLVIPISTNSSIRHFLILKCLRESQVKISVGSWAYTTEERSGLLR